MIFVRDYIDILEYIGREYFIFAMHRVADLTSWAKKKGFDLSEPFQTMKVITEGGDKLVMYIQSEIDEDVLDRAMDALSVRWSLRDNVSDPSPRLHSIREKLVYVFLKEYSKTVTKVAGDELLEDAWAIEAMDKFGLLSKKG
ncbi:MAG: hypothetical protein ACLPX5_15450 [Dissulfurispiraceae bacterium]